MNNIVCAIDLGSTAVRMEILEVKEKGQYRRLDRINRPVNIGRDVFISNSISPESMSQVVNIFVSFAELMKAWNIAPSQAHVVATSAVREARNRDIFVDRIETRTEFRVQVLNGIEENHLTYIAVHHAIKNLYKKSLSRSNSIIMEVGGGTVELMIMQKGKMQVAINLKMGTVRLEQQFRSKSYSGFSLEDFVLEQMRPSIANLQMGMDLKNIRHFIMVGGDARLAGRKIGEKQGEHYALIERKKFVAWGFTMRNMTPADIVRHLDVGYNQADGLLLALLIFKVFLDKTSASQIIVPDVSIREGVFLRDMIGPDVYLDQNFTSHVVASALSLAHRYNIDEKHAQLVRNMSLDLYDQICEQNGLGNKERLYLEVSTILHSVGYFVNHSGYHKHGQYIVSHSEIFGLTQDEIGIVAHVIRYHRGNRPANSHVEFMALSRAQRLVVIKLATIIRVVNILAQTPYSEAFKMKMENSTLYVSGGQGMLADRLLQQFAFFEDVFGYKIAVR